MNSALELIKKIFAVLGKVVYDGKSLIAYILMNVPQLTDYPMLKAALIAMAQDPSNATNQHNLLVQILLLVAATHRAGKLLQAIIKMFA